MGKANARSKKPIEANEFLNDLIDQVNALENLGDDEVHDDSASSQGYELDDNTNHKNANASQDEDIPTIFADLNRKSEADKNAIRNPHQYNSNPQDKTTPSIDSAPSHSQREAYQETVPNTGAQNTATVASNASTSTNLEPDRTIAVEGARGKRPVLEEKVATGALRGTRNGQVYTSLDASLAQSETLKIAQARIKELEIEADRLRMENDDLASAGDVVTRRVEDLQIRLHRLEKEKSNLVEQHKSETLILKGNLQFKETDLSKTKAKLEDLEMRIKSDFRKIRVRERELENRLELVRGEKQALMRSKDEKILDLQRKQDQYKSELELYRSKVQDLNKLMESQQDQMQKTIRALKVALVNLEHDDSSDMQVENFSDQVSDEHQSQVKKSKME